MTINIPHQNGSRRIVVFSGAGISVPSGLQSFNTKDGLWNDHKIEDVCSITTFKSNFKIAHKFYNQRRIELSKVKPSEGHYLIKYLVDTYGKENIINITQNIDDLFERLDIKSLKLHGTLTSMYCGNCNTSWDIGYKEFDIKKDKCPKCNTLKEVRPDIIMYGEFTENYTIMYYLFEALENKDSIFLIIGTEGNVVDLTYWLKNTEAYSILVNPKLPNKFNKENIDVIYENSIEVVVENIKKDIAKHWSN